jgi:hypothetical protein
VATRVLVAYLLIAALLVCAGVLAWRAYYYSDRKVRHRARRARREQRARSEADDARNGAD